MNFLKDILQAVTAPVHGVENAAKALAGNHAGGGVGQAMQGIGKGVAQAAAPDLTYNPNPNTNIPNSTHDANFARALAGNPGLMKQMLLNVIAPHLSADSNAQVQGQQNPGYTPLQNSGQGGKGYAANLQPANVNWQNTDGVSRNMVNPQVSDNGFYYNN